MLVRPPTVMALSTWRVHIPVKLASFGFEKFHCLPSHFLIVLGHLFFPSWVCDLTPLQTTGPGHSRRKQSPWPQSNLWACVWPFWVNRFCNCVSQPLPVPNPRLGWLLGAVTVREASFFCFFNIYFPAVLDRTTPFLKQMPEGCKWSLFGFTDCSFVQANLVANPMNRNVSWWWNPESQCLFFFFILNCVINQSVWCVNLRRIVSLVSHTWDKLDRSAELLFTESLRPCESTCPFVGIPDNFLTMELSIQSGGKKM